MKWVRAIPNAPSGWTPLKTGCWSPAWAMRWTGARRRSAPVGDIELAHGRMHVAAMRGLSDQLADEINAGGPTTPDRPRHLHQRPHLGGGACGPRRRAGGHRRGDRRRTGKRLLRGAPAGPPCLPRQGHGLSAFFNNVAIAARYALERHGLQRVAVVDFDVHHGNGTEDILATTRAC
jgi:hypothetical protein